MNNIVEDKDMNNSNKIYIVLSNNYTMIGRIICMRQKLHFGFRNPATRYSHVSLSADKELHNMLSFARKKMRNPFVAGLVKEDISAELFALKPDTNRIAVMSVEVSEKQYADIIAMMNDYWKRRNEYKYNSGGLIRIVIRGRMRKPDKRKSYFYCSQWVDKVLKDCGVDIFTNQQFYTITPSDFYIELKDKIVYEGLTKEYINARAKDTSNIL